MWTSRVGVHYAKDTHRRPHSLPPHHPSGKNKEFFRRGNWAPNFRLFQELSVAAGCEDSFSICLSLIGYTSTGSLPWLAKNLSFKKRALWLALTREERPATSCWQKCSTPRFRESSDWGIDRVPELIRSQAATESPGNWGSPVSRQRGI